MQRPVAISYLVFALLLIFAAALQLATPFLAALFCYFALSKLTFFGRKWIAVTLFIVLLAVGFSGFVFFLKRALVVLPEIVETAVPVVVKYAEARGVELPFTDMEGLRAVALDSVRDVLGNLGLYVKIATKEFLFLVIGVVVAVGVFLNPHFEPERERQRKPNDLYSYYTTLIRERFRSFYRSFEIVIGAQLIISAINTTLTAVFVLACGLRYATVVIILTFFCGLLPIIGNIISNTVIIGIAFTISPKLAAWAFVFLVVIHKLEYFLNSNIIGGRIHHPMWLTLLALLIGDRLMGIAGIILAPVVLSFIKVEMKKVRVGGGRDEGENPTPPRLREPEVVADLGSGRFFFARRLGFFRRRLAGRFRRPLRGGQLRLHRFFCRRRRRGGRRQVALAEFLRVREFVEILQAEVIQEKLRRLVEQRPPGDLGAPGDFHQPALHQTLEHAIDRDTAHRLDVRARDRLAVGHDRERLQGRRGQARGLDRRKKLSHPARVGRVARELPALGALEQLERAALLDQLHLELLERRGDLRFLHLPKLVRHEFLLVARAFDRAD